jgi:hypothetical protein
LYKLLIDQNISEDKFSLEVIKNRSFTNDSILKKSKEDFMENLSHMLESRGIKYFTPIMDMDTNDILIVRKYGISLDLVMRNFKLSKSEALELMRPNGFIEKYANLKLNAIFKDMVKKATNLSKKADLDTN